VADPWPLLSDLRVMNRKPTLGKPDQRDLNENLAATHGLAHMIQEHRQLFQVRRSPQRSPEGSPQRSPEGSPESLHEGLHGKRKRHSEWFHNKYYTYIYNYIIYRYIYVILLYIYIIVFHIYIL